MALSVSGQSFQLIDQHITPTISNNTPLLHRLSSACGLESLSRSPPNVTWLLNPRLVLRPRLESGDWFHRIGDTDTTIAGPITVTCISAGGGGWWGIRWPQITRPTVQTVVVFVQGRHRIRAKHQTRQGTKIDTTAQRLRQARLLTANHCSEVFQPR